MNISFTELMILQYFGYVINGIGILYTMHLLWNIKIRFLRSLLSLLVFSGLFSTLIAIIEKDYMNTYLPATIEISFNVLKAVALVLYYMYLFNTRDVKRLFPSVMIASALELSVEPLFSWFAIAYLKTNSIVFIYLFQIIAICLFVMLLMYLLSKTKILSFYREFLEHGIFTIPLTLLYLLAESGIMLFLRTRGIDRFQMLNAVGYIIVFLVIGIVAKDIYYKRQLKQSEMMLLQQDLYVNHLEQIQLELRSVQHDYNNMIAGLYVQADTGNIDAVKEYVNKKIWNMDERLLNDIRKTNQILQIAHMELKGLLLVKIMTAQQVGVEIELEVLYKVEKIAIEVSDLLRCMGILLDNAIEEAQNTCSKRVLVILLQEPDKLSIIVKNEAAKAVDMARIWENGYSTKGEKRGLGLCNYAKILSKYENVFFDTKLEEQQFVQVLIIT